MSTSRSSTFGDAATLAGAGTGSLRLGGELGEDQVLELDALSRLEHVALHQDVLEFFHRLFFDHRRRLPNLQPPVAFGSGIERLRADAGKERFERLRSEENTSEL